LKEKSLHIICVGLCFVIQDNQTVVFVLCAVSRVKLSCYVKTCVNSAYVKNLLINSALKVTDQIIFYSNVIERLIRKRINNSGL